MSKKNQIFKQTKKVFAALILLFITIFQAFSSRSRPKITFDSTETQEKTEIPLQLRYFYDNAAYTDCNLIWEGNFKPCDNPLFPGAYEGTLWLEATFADTSVKNGMNYVISFGDININFAELFIWKNGAWTLRGRNGMSIPRNKITKPSYRVCIPFILTDFPQNETEHKIRLRISSSIGERIHVKIIPENEFSDSTNRFYRLFHLMGGIAFFIIIFLIAIGIIIKDPYYIMLSITAIFFVLLQMQTRGVGPVYIWNEISSLCDASRPWYVFECGLFSSIVIAATILLRNNSRPIFFNKAVPFFFEFLIIILAVNIVVESESHIFYIFIFIFSSTQIFFIISLLVSLKKIDKTPKTIVLFWIPCIAYSIVLKLFTLSITASLIKPKTEFNSFIFSSIAFLGITAPSIYLLGKKHKFRYDGIFKNLEQTKKSLQEEKTKSKLYLTAFYRLMTPSKIIFNTSTIISKNPSAEKLLPQLKVIEFCSAKIHDSIYSMEVFMKKIPEEKKNIAIRDYATNCIDVSKSLTKQKDIFISQTIALADDLIVRADPNILEMLFIDILFIISSISNTHSRITIFIENHNEDFKITITSSMTNKTYTEISEQIRDKDSQNDFTYISNILKIYSGSIEVDKINEGARFKVSLKLPVSNMQDAGIVIEKTGFSKNNKVRPKIQTGETSIGNVVVPSRQVISQDQKSDDTTERETSKTLFITENTELSSREKEITLLIAEGKSDKEIAMMLNISPATVATHNKKIYRKLNVHSRVELIKKLM